MRKTILFMMAGALLASTGTAYGTAYFDGLVDTAYENNANWTGVIADKSKGVEVRSDAVVSEYGPTAGTPDANNIAIGYNIPNPVNVTVNAGARLRSKNFWVGGAFTNAVGTGSMDVYGQIASRGLTFGIGHDWGGGVAGGTGEVNVHNGGVMNVLNATGLLELGSITGAQGTLNINTGGITDVQGGQVFIGDGAGGTGIINVNGGTLLSSRTGNLGFDVGSYGNGQLNITAGLVDIEGRLNLSHFAGSTGHVQIDGGQLIAPDIWEWDGDGSLDVTNGELIITDVSKLGRINTFISTGIITAWGGTVAPLVWTDAAGVHVTPEPATGLLLGFGALFLRRRR